MIEKDIEKNLKEALKSAYSPYSNVKVAAAIEFSVNGKREVVYGVNVENVSYGLTCCAERSAVSTAILKGMTTIEKIYVMSNQEKPITPCGACRQVVSEFIGDPDAPVICVNEAGTDNWQTSIEQLLPNRFDL